MVAQANSCGVNFLKNNWLFCGPLNSCRKNRLGNIAGELAKELKQLPRQDLASAQRHPTVLAARRFLKHLTVIDPRIERCRRELLAMKLGISSSVFKHNSGFQKFAVEHHLERHLMEYGHHISVDATTKKVSLLANGVFKAWDEISTCLAQAPQSRRKPFRPWIYGANGIQNRDMYRWKKLKPYKRGNPADWGRRYIFEFCANCSKSPQLAGDHSWFRLKTPTGDIYSVGLYPQERLLSTYVFPLRTRRGHLMQPDETEFYPDGATHRIAVEITKSQFLKMKRTIENDKKEGKLIFHVFQFNCLMYVKKIAAIAGIDLPTKSSGVRMILPGCLHPILDKTPRIIKKICVVVFALFLNLLQMLLGTGWIDNTVIIQRGSEVKSYFSSFWDLFRPSKVDLHHPHTLGTRTYQWVKNWRKQEIAKLRQQLTGVQDQGIIASINKQMDDINYRLPPMPS